MRYFNVLQKIGVIALIGGLTASAFAQTKPFDVTRMDPSALACDDFYQYSNGTWVKNAQIPGDRSSYGSFDILYESNQNTLHDILETTAKNTHAAQGSSEQLTGDIYASCMDTAAIEAAGLKPLEPYLKQINVIKDARGVQNIIAQMHNDGFRALFGFGVGADDKNSVVNLGFANQSGLSLPSRDYYLDDRFKEIREKFLAHMTNMFVLLGEEAGQAKTDAETVMKLQTRLAQASKTNAELRDSDANYNKITVAEAQKLTPNFDWKGYFATRGAAGVKDLSIGQPKFFEAVSQMMSDTPAAEWKTYLRWMLVTGSANRLPKRFVDENFSFFSQTLRGVKEQPARWKTCVATADGTVGEALGAEYVKRAFTPEAKKRMDDLINNLFAAYRERLAQIDWMSPETRQKALAKLSTYQRKIGFNEHPRGYVGLKLDRQSFFDNRIRAARFESARNLRDLEIPVDKTRWGMSPPTVNAYYNQSYNEIVFPAGILQPPFFNATADDALNYGSIGAVIGHEITHGFDDEGSKYDPQGNLKSWWTESDRKQFNSKADCVKKQFGGYEVLPSVFMKGDLTLGENIADLGGLTIAYAAFEKSLEGKPRPVNVDEFTPEQRFFLGWSQVWADKSTDKAIELQAQTNEHAIAKFRVNGPLSNLPVFAEAFQCKIGDKMVRDDRCQIW